MFIRLLLLMLFLFCFSSYSFSYVKKLGSIKPILDIRSMFVINFHNEPSRNELFFDFREAGFGLEAEIRDNVLIRMDFEVSGHTGNLADEGGIDIEPRFIFGEVVFSKVVPFYLKVGKFELGTTITHDESPFIRENNFITEASLVNNLAVEFGYRYGDTIQVGGGVYYVDNISNRARPEEWYTYIDNYYVYARFSYGKDDLSFIFNSGFASNLSDSTALGLTEAGLSMVSHGTVELILRYKLGYFLIGASFPKLITTRFEVAYDSETMTVGFYTNIRVSRKGDPFVIEGPPGSTGAIELPGFKPPVRLGGMFAYKLFSGFQLGVEGYYDFYVRVDAGYDASLTFVLTYELPDYTFYF